MKLTNPILTINEAFNEATTISEKILVIFISIWISVLLTLNVTGITYLIYELITNPSQFNNATWGVFDTLG